MTGLRDDIAKAKESPRSAAARLARLDPLEADALAPAEAKRLGVRVGVLRAAIDAARAGKAEPAGKGKPKGIPKGEARSGGGGGGAAASGPADDGEPSFLPLTEDSLALDLVERHRDRLRFCHSSGRWLLWSETRWKRSETEEVLDLARDLCRLRAGGTKSTAAQKMLGRRATVLGVEGLARADRRVAVTGEVFDTDPWLLGTPGGTVDLRDGELRRAVPAELITRSTTVAPAEPGTPCPLWDAFVREVTEAEQDDGEQMRFVQQMLGYCLTGLTSEQALFFIHGPGGNGKGVLLAIVSAIMGDYHATVPMEVFTQTFGDRHPAELVLLDGPRMVSAEETEQGRSWNASRLQAVTGEGKIAARRMREDWYEFQPICKVVLIGNHQPQLHSVGPAIARRMRVIPFTARPPRPDPGLRDKLMAEAPAILRWLIDGAVEWHAGGGLPASERIDVTTKGYLEGQDVLGQWLEECCDTNERPLGQAAMAARVWRGGGMWADRSGALFDSWKKFCEANGERPGKQKSFSQDLQGKGFLLWRTSESRLVLGIKLRGTGGVTGSPGLGLDDGS